jgi:hypothetical protein
VWREQHAGRAMHHAGHGRGSERVFRLPQVRYTFCTMAVGARRACNMINPSQREMRTMTDLDEMKSLIVKALRDEDMASSACAELEAYAKRWPYVFLVNDWDVWSESKRALRLQVIRWLEQNGGSYDFYQLPGGWGLVGFTELKAATHFKLRWSGQGRVMSASAPPSAAVQGSAPVQDWNPHPLRSTFELHPSEAPRRPRYSGQAAG